MKAFHVNSVSGNLILNLLTIFLAELIDNSCLGLFPLIQSFCLSYKDRKKLLRSFLFSGPVVNMPESHSLGFRIARRQLLHPAFRPEMGSERKEQTPPYTLSK